MKTSVGGLFARIFETSQPAMESEWVALDFRVPGSKSADARDGILLLIVMGHNGLCFRL